MALQLLPMAIGALATGFISLAAFGPGFGDQITQWIYGVWPARILSVADLIRSYRRGVITESEFITEMGKSGFTKERAVKMYESEFDTLTPREALVLYFRNQGKRVGNSSNDFQWLESQLVKAGMRKEETIDFIEANRPMPTPADLVMFTARDVFEPAQREKVNRGSEPPSEFLAEMELLGFPRDKAAWYWYAHWYIPSISQCFEMQQRLFDHPDPETRFTPDDMKIAFDLQDIAPGFRKSLEAISYNTINRVDIRRLYRSGVYGKTEEEAKPKIVRAFREIGLSPRDAELMATFTIAYEQPEERDFSRGQIIEMYLEGTFGENGKTEAEKLLRELRYSDEEIKRMLDLAERKHISAQEQIELNRIKADYLRDDIKTDAELMSALSVVPLTSTQVRNYLKDWKGEKERTRQRMSLKDADRLRRINRISRSEWKRIYIQSGLSKEDVNLLDDTFDLSGESDRREPSTNDLRQWLESRIIDGPTFKTKMLRIGHTVENIKLYALQVGVEIE